MIIKGLILSIITNIVFSQDLCLDQNDLNRCYWRDPKELHSCKPAYSSGYLEFTEVKATPCNQYCCCSFDVTDINNRSYIYNTYCKAVSSGCVYNNILRKYEINPQIKNKKINISKF